MSAETPSFACAHCGRTYRWSAAIAGQSRLCACGEVMRVPDAPDPFADDRGAYAADESPDSGDAPVESAGQAGVLAYEDQSEAMKQQRFTDAMYDPFRDRKLPLGLLIFGSVAILAWFVLAAARGMISWQYLGLLRFLSVSSVDALVLVGMALLIAPRMGVGFGQPRHAVVKFTAMLLLIYGADLWLHTLTFAMRGPRAGHVADYCAVFAAMLILLWCFARLFEIEDVRFVLFLVVSMLAMHMATDVGIAMYRKGPPRLATAAAPTSAPVPATPPTPADMQIAATIAAGMANGTLRDGHEWIAAGAGHETASAAAKVFYEAGATSVHVGQLPNGRSVKLYVELPADPRKRELLVKMVERFQAATPQAASPQTTPGQYMELVVPNR